MSKNSKNARRLAQAREFSKSRQNGTKGPTRHNVTSKKRNAWWQKFPSYAAFCLGKKQGRQRGGVTEEVAIDVPEASAAG